MVQLSRQYKEQGLAVVSLSFDEPDQEDAVLKFLEQQEGRFDNLIVKPGGDAFEQFDTPNGIPLYKLYDQFGLLRYQFSPTPDGLENGEPVENIDQRVKQLLNE